VLLPCRVLGVHSFLEVLLPSRKEEWIRDDYSWHQIFASAHLLLHVDWHVESWTQIGTFQGSKCREPKTASQTQTILILFDSMQVAHEVGRVANRGKISNFPLLLPSGNLPVKTHGDLRHNCSLQTQILYRSGNMRSPRQAYSHKSISRVCAYAHRPAGYTHKSDSGLGAWSWEDLSLWERGKIRDGIVGECRTP
jgi:hypothetical protein